jgi:hypothetical protein
VARDGYVVAQCRRTGNLPSQAYVWSLRQPAALPRLISGTDRTNAVAGNGTAGTFVAVAADGAVVAFDADASDLVPGDTNQATDIFAYIDERVLSTALVSDGFEPPEIP